LIRSGEKPLRQGWRPVECIFELVRYHGSRRHDAVGRQGVNAPAHRHGTGGLQERSREVKKEIWKLDEIEVDVTGFFTTHHVLRTKAGILGELTFPAFAQYATYRARDGRTLLMQKPHLLDTTHELLEDEVVRGTGTRPGLLRRDIAVQVDGRQYSLEPMGILSQGWRLVDASGANLLELQPRGIFRQGAHLTVTGAVDADVVAFAYYLVHMRQQEEAASAASVASVAATS
jgi:hypothetical protein